MKAKHWQPAVPKNRHLSHLTCQLFSMFYSLASTDFELFKNQICPGTKKWKLESRYANTNWGF